MAGRRDEYGNPIPEQQGYGNVTGDQYRTGAGAGYGSGAGDYYGTNAPHETVLGAAGGQRHPVHPEKQAEGHGLSGMLHRSGSSSSSSSEDDGLGGRRKKKGMKEKIKEKLPGGHKDDQGYGHATTGYGGTTATTGHGTTTTGEYGGATAGYGTHDQPEKKGMMEKIKEKLPGGHKDEGYGHATTGYGGTTATTGHGTTTTGEYGGATTGYGSHDQPEKKGIMDKIKEKLPGSHH